MFKELSSGRKTSFRHLRMVFKLSYLDKTYITCLQDNLNATNCKRPQKCLLNTSNRHLIQMSTSDVSRRSFKDVFQTDFFKSKQKKRKKKWFTDQVSTWQQERRVFHNKNVERCSNMIIYFEISVSSCIVSQFRAEIQNIIHVHDPCL